MKRIDLLKAISFIFLIGMVVLLAVYFETKWVAIIFALTTLPCGWWFLLYKKKSPDNLEIKNSSISCCHYLYDDLEYDAKLNTTEKKEV